jgi:hypothetical protein
MIQLSRIGWGAVLPMVLLLSACGGGSGGGGNDSPEEQTGPQLSYDNKNFAQKAVSITSDSGTEGLISLRDDLSLGWSILGEYTSAIQEMSILDQGTYPCAGGGNLEIRWTETENSLEETTRFNRCVLETPTYGPVVISGSTFYESVLIDETETSASWKSSYRDDLSGTIQRTGESLRFSGVLRLSEYLKENGGVTSWRDVRDIKRYEMMLGNRYVAIADAQNRDSGTDVDSEYAVRATIVGSAIGGYMKLETPDPVEFSSNLECPVSGIVKLSSNGEAEVRFGSSAGGTAKAVAVWVDGAVVESYEDCSEIGVVLYF